jgi:uncharacterized membrane protein YedE/YeeE
MTQYLLTVLAHVPGAGSLALAELPGTDPLSYAGPAWSPYLVGALIGVLSMATFYFSAKPLGASSAYATLAGLLGRAVAPKHTDSLKYFQDKKPAVNWELMLVFGTVLGAFLAAWHGSELTGQWLPLMWAARFGESSLPLRIVVALIGGVFMAFGARLAGGCTSGHGISGTLQLSVGSWIAVICFFIGGIATAMLIFRV